MKYNNANEYADMMYRGALLFTSYLLQLCHVTNQDDYSSGADSREEVTGNQENPSQDKP